MDLAVFGVKLCPKGNSRLDAIACVANSKNFERGVAFIYDAEPGSF